MSEMIYAHINPGQEQPQAQAPAMTPEQQKQFAEAVQNAPAELVPVQAEQIAAAPQQTTMNAWTDAAAFDQLFRMAQLLSNSSIVPQAYQGKVEDCFIALDLATRMQLAPLVVMQNLFVVKGKPSWAGQACKMLIESCGKFCNAQHNYFGQPGTDERGCYLTAFRLSDGAVVQGAAVTIGMAKAEGWTNNSKWRNMPELMLAYRAAAFFARVHCPEALMGVQTSEEVYDVDAANSRGSTANNFMNKIRG